MELSSIALQSLSTPTTSSANSSASGADFSALLTNAMTESLTQATLASGSSGSSESLLPGTAMLDVQGALLSSAASGQSTDDQIMMFMMVMMMQQMDGGDMAPMLGAMSGAFSAMGSISGAASALQESGSGRSYAGAALSSALGTASSAIGAFTGATHLPLECWVPASPALQTDSSNRSSSTLQQVVSQFNVDNAARYAPYKTGKDTYCNIFLWDVTSALGCEIPHWVDAQTGAPRTYPDIDGARELGANATHDWLLTTGRQYGWREVSASEAQAAANAGLPAVTAWKNPTGGAGHVQIVVPSANGGYDAARGVTVAQAGSRCTSYDYISNTFKASQLDDVRYFVHA